LIGSKKKAKKKIFRTKQVLKQNQKLIIGYETAVGLKTSNKKKMLKCSHRCFNVEYRPFNKLCT